MGAWIEMVNETTYSIPQVVAPCMGAWIEIFDKLEDTAITLSHPAWVRGLKSG